MKRILKILSVLALAIAAMGLYSCGEESDTPDGMQLVRGGEEYGYKFYVPEEWVVSCYGDFACAYVSTVNNTSVTFAEAQMPEYGSDGMTEDEIRTYFYSSMQKLEYMKNSMQVSVDGEGCNFGKESGAYKFIYTYDYPMENGNLIHYRAMQIIRARGGRLYIFQYNSQNSVPSYSTDQKTHYEIYFEKVNEIINEFKFLDTPLVQEPITAGSSGDFILVSDSDLCGFDFYAPNDSLEVISSALVHRDLGSGASVSVSELVSIESSSGYDAYWEGLKANMEKSFSSVTETAKGNRALKGASAAYCYEYTYSYAGKNYCGYTILISTGTKSFNAKFYIFNYSAPEQFYGENLELLEKMLSELEFK